ncbi:DUF305 domain-containing protein [Glaciihabitans sp. dw_435]|uniref:DUF305 domain-containing protein n=1 Tax=Glaciihabitans sp. dw_435 TaxID=2720081 RepID=UPI001BD3177D|nr:DUF305 domain-containing protein [Glaciihabitans sp. dw_435]
MSTPASAPTTAAAPTPAHRGRRILAITLAALLLLVGAFAAGRITGPQTGTPGDHSVEAGFARDMQTHHNQAVEMSLLVRDLTTDPTVRSVAYDIATSQGSQSGQLYGFLAEWKLPQVASEPSMTWMTQPTLAGDSMSHDGMATASAHEPGSPMPGLATPAQMAHLRTLTGVAAEKEYLTLMIAHHKGGIEMAQALLDRSTYPSVVALAKGVITAQTSEIGLMQDMLAARS